MQRLLIFGFIAFVALYGVFVTVRSVYRAAVLEKKDRIQIVFYGQKPYFLSLGLTDNVNYVISYVPELKVKVPGGYGSYAVGALGRLSEIEKDPTVVQRAFSSMTSSNIEYYVMPEKNDTYLSQPPSDEEKERGNTFDRLTLIRQIFSSDYSDNIPFFDSLHIILMLSRKRNSDFIILDPVIKEVDKELTYYEQGFQKKYKGFFFHQTLREEAHDVSILYSNYAAALNLARVIEGQGIRVVDLSSLDEARKERCTVQHNFSKNTKTVAYLVDQFDCIEEKSETEGSDIIMVLGESIQKEWK